MKKFFPFVLILFAVFSIVTPALAQSGRKEVATVGWLDINDGFNGKEVIIWDNPQPWGGLGETHTPIKPNLEKGFTGMYLGKITRITKISILNSEYNNPKKPEILNHKKVAVHAIYGLNGKGKDEIRECLRLNIILLDH